MNKKQMKNRKKIKTKNKGITLIALVITIIVLLILAGVTISALSGDNGILTNASKAKYATELSQYKEELEMFKSNKVLENLEFEDESLFSAENSIEYNTKKDDTEKNIYDIIPSLKGTHFGGKLEIIKGELLLNSQDKSEIEVAQSVGIAVNPYEIIEGELISSNGNLLLMDETGTLRLPESVTSIGVGAFSNVEGLKTIIIPGTVKEIKKDAFRNNTTLENVIMEDGVEIVGEHAFEGCRNLKEINLPDSIIEIRTHAFYECSSIKNIEIPSKIKSLNNMVFSMCTNLSNVTFRGNELETIQNEAFYGCAIEKFEITSKVSNIVSTAFSQCKNLDNFIINDNKNFVYESGLLMTKNKEDVIFVSTKYLASITEFTIPDGVKNFKVDISNLNNVTKLNIPASVESLYPRSLPINLEEVTINENNKIYKTYKNAIYSKNGETLIYCYSKDKIIELEEEIKTIDEHSFIGAKNVEEIILPDSVEIINRQIIDHTINTNLKKIKIGKNVSQISPMFAYYMDLEVEIDSNNPYYMTENKVLYTKNKDKLITVNYLISGKFIVDSNVKEIEDNAFYNQNGMTEIDLGTNIEKLGEETFYNCSRLSKIEIPQSVKTIASNTFSAASNLKEIIINNKENAIQGAPWGCPAGNRAIIWKDI